jgi:hypothetical protein
MRDLTPLQEEERARRLRSTRWAKLAYSYSTVYAVDTTPGISTDYPTASLWQKALDVANRR